MLHPELTQISHSVPAKVADTAVVSEEGMALIIDGALEDGNGITVKPSITPTDANPGRFYGVSMFERRPPAIMPDVLEFTMPSTTPSDGDKLAELPYTPNTDSTIVFADNDKLDGPVMSSGDNTATQLGLVIDGRSVQAKTGDGDANKRYLGVGPGSTGTVGIANGSKIRIQYAYTPTMAQQIALVGSNVNLSPVGAGAKIMCIRKGIIYTTNYLTNSDSGEYIIGGTIRLGAGGTFSRNEDHHLAADRAVIIHVPSMANPFLGLELF